MAEEARQGLQSFVWWNAGLLDASMKRRARPALAAALVVFALLEAVLYSHVLSILPSYPAVIAALFVWAILPGWLVQRALFASRETTVVEQGAVAFLMSMALAAAAGLLGLQLHLSLEAFATLYALTAATAGGLAVLWQRGDTNDIDTAEPSGGLPVVLLAAVLGALVIAILTAPAWGDDISRDADDLVYTAYVNHYVNHDSLDASQLFSGARQGAFGRMSVNVWVADESLLADQAGVRPFDLLQSYLPPLMTALAVAATFAFAKGLFRSTMVGLLAGLIMLAYGAIDLSPHEGFGRNIFLRIAEDKMVASFVLLPLAVLLASSFIARPGWRSYAAVQLAVVGLAVVHPMTVVFLAVAFVSITLFRALAGRSVAPLRGGGAIALPWVLPGLAFLAVSGLGDSGRVLGDELQYRRQFHLTDLSGGLLVGNFHMILHPLVLLALLSAPLLWFWNRRDAGAQVTMALVAGVLLVFFVPFIATPTARVVSEQGVWRLPWLLPVPTILAYGCYQAAARLTTSRARTFAALGAALLVTGGALVAQELFVRADGGDFYNRTSTTTIVPGTDQSVVIGGIDRAFSRDWRPSPRIEEVINYLRDTVPPGATVLAPAAMGRFFPGALEDVHPVDEFGAADPFGRAVLVNGFYDQDLRGSELTSALKKYGVTYIVVHSSTGEEEAVQSMGAVAIEPFEPSVAFGVASFAVRQGEPQVALRGPEGSGYLSWSFDSQRLEELRGPEFVAPAGSLTALLEIAPAADVTVDATVRLVVTVERIEDGQLVAGSQRHTVFDTSLPAGATAGKLLLRLRSLSPMTPGATYSVRVWRDGASPLDTYPQDIWLAGMKFVGETAGQPSEYHVFRYEATATVPVASAGFFDYQAIAGLTPGARDTLIRLKDGVPAGSTVLAPPSIGSTFYDTLPGVRPVDDVLASDLEERRAFVTAVYNNSLAAAEIEAGLRRYGVRYAVLNAGTTASSLLALVPGGTQAQPLAELAAEAFQPAKGRPELATREDDGEQYQAWAFDPVAREVAAGPQLTVPKDLPANLDLVVTLAPAAEVPVNGGTVRFVVTLDRLEGGTSVGKPTSAVFDVALEPGSPAGARFVRVRSVALRPGAMYAVRVFRDGGHRADTYSGDVWFSRLTIAPPSYDVYEVQ